MPRQVGFSPTNNFSAGLVTEATGLNFPENACTEIWNCELPIDGSIARRQGFQNEILYEEKTINRTSSAVTQYVWKNVGGNGDITAVVVQVGATLYFYRLHAAGAISVNPLSSTVTLTAVAGAVAPGTIEAQFTDGGGYLFVTHPSCEPMRVIYDIDFNTVSSENITIRIRDLEGDPDDPYEVDERPTADLDTLDIHHYYNLLNQGWTQENLELWESHHAFMPSNADIPWVYKADDGAIDYSTDVLDRHQHRGNSPAPKGHYILEAADQDRDEVSGLTGTTSNAPWTVRPSTCAFFAGRLFYAGIASLKFNSSIYFTQVVERDEQYGDCFQLNDPTSEETFDLLPTDGGVIKIRDAGTIIKLVSVPGGLVVFAANGVWFITGSTGLGFTANDYTIQKISSTNCLTGSSFVDIGGMPSWWNADGIYIISSEQGGAIPSVKNISTGKIKSFYDNIPAGSKRSVKGCYNPIDNTVKWIYRSEDAGEDLTDRYEYDRVLTLNILTQAFHPWTITEHSVKVNGIVVVDPSGYYNGVDVPIYKYLVSYPSAGSYKFTYAETKNDDFVDFPNYGGGELFESYFITGFKIQGQAINKFQTHWLRLYSQTYRDMEYDINSIWDFALTGDGTGKWSNTQRVYHNNDDVYSNQSKRLRVRGHGLILQFKVTSVEAQAFHLIGWIAMQSSNQLP